MWTSDDYARKRIANREAKEKAEAGNTDLEARGADLARREAEFTARLEADRAAVLNPETRDEYFKRLKFDGYAGMQQSMMEHDGLADQRRDPRVDELESKIRQMEEVRVTEQRGVTEQQQRFQEQREYQESVEVVRRDFEGTEWGEMSNSQAVLPTGRKVGEGFNQSVYFLLSGSEPNPATGNPYSVPEAAAVVKKKFLDTAVALLQSQGIDTSGLQPANPSRASEQPVIPDQGGASPEVRPTTNLTQGGAPEARSEPRRNKPETTTEWANRWAAKARRAHLADLVSEEG